MLLSSCYRTVSWSARSPDVTAVSYSEIVHTPQVAGLRSLELRATSSKVQVSAVQQPLCSEGLFAEAQITKSLSTRKESGWSDTLFNVGLTFAILSGLAAATPLVWNEEGSDTPSTPEQIHQGGLIGLASSGGLIALSLVDLFLPEKSHGRSLTRPSTVAIIEPEASAWQPCKQKTRLPETALYYKILGAPGSPVYEVKSDKQGQYELPSSLLAELSRVATKCQRPLAVRFSLTRDAQPKGLLELGYTEEHKQPGDWWSHPVRQWLYRHAANVHLKSLQVVERIRASDFSNNIAYTSSEKVFNVSPNKGETAGAAPQHPYLKHVWTSCQKRLWDTCMYNENAAAADHCAITCADPSQGQSCQIARDVCIEALSGLSDTLQAKCQTKHESCLKAHHLDQQSISDCAKQCRWNAALTNCGQTPE